MATITPMPRRIETDGFIERDPTAEPTEEFRFVIFAKGIEQGAKIGRIAVGDLEGSIVPQPINGNRHWFTGTVVAGARTPTEVDLQITEYSEEPLVRTPPQLVSGNGRSNGSH